MASGDLIFKIVGDTRGLSSSLAKAEGSLGKLGVASTGASSKLGALGTVGAGGLASLATAGVAAVTAIGVASVKAAEEGQKVNAQLRNSIANVGQSYDDYKGKIDATSKRLAAYGFQNDDVESSIGRLALVTKDTQKAIDLQGLAADIARGRNIDLADATSILVKVESGHVGLLGRLGIQTKDAAGKTISQEEAVKKLSQLYGGAASANAKTFAGKMQALSAEFHNMEEQLGARLIPILSDFASAMQLAEKGANTADTGLKKVGLSVSSLATATAKSLPGIGALVTAHEVLGATGKKTADQLSASEKVTKELADATKKYQDDLAGGHASQKQLADDAKAVADAQAKQDAIQKSVTAAMGQSADASKADADAKKKQADAYKKAEDKIRGYVDAIFESRDAQRATLGASLDLADAQDAYTQAVKDATAAGGKDAEKNREVLRTYSDLQATIDEVATAAGKSAEKQAELAHKSFSAADGAKAQRDALIRLRDQISPSSPFRAYLEGLIRDLDKVAKDRHATITLGVIGQVGTHGTVALGNSRLAFAQGGIVPGPIGAPVPAIVHGGERVLTKEQQQQGVTIHLASTIVVSETDGGDRMVRKLTKALNSGQGRADLLRALQLNR